MATMHLGSVERGLKIIREFSHVVRFNNVRASIKLQFPDVENSTNSKAKIIGNLSTNERPGPRTDNLNTKVTSCDGRLPA